MSRVEMMVPHNVGTCGCMSCKTARTALTADLLAALKRLRDLPVECSQEEDRAAWAFAHAAIAKAEGR